MNQKNKQPVQLLCSLFATTSLVILLILVPIVSLFHDDSFYHYAYTQNFAYEQLDHELVWSVTKNFQAYLQGHEELIVFDEDQASHLSDVKDLYTVGKAIILLALLAHVISVVIMWKNGWSWYSRVLKQSAIITLATLIVLFLLALNWQWFFTQFHLLFFEDNWQFSSASLMIRLWGGSFFIFAAAYSALQSTLISIVIFLMGKAILITGNQS
jgi:uncharacterized membrane protein